MSSFCVSLLAHELGARGLRMLDISLWDAATELHQAGIEDPEDLAGVSLDVLTHKWSKRDAKAIQEHI